MGEKHHCTECGCQVKITASASSRHGEHQHWARSVSLHDLDKELGPVCELWFDNLTKEHDSRKTEATTTKSQPGWSPCPAGGTLNVSAPSDPLQLLQCDSPTLWPTLLPDSPQLESTPVGGRLSDRTASSEDDGFSLFGDKQAGPENNRDKLLALSLDSADISWTSSMATPPNTLATGELPVEEQRQKGPARALFSPDKSADDSELGDTALDMTVEQEEASISLFAADSILTATPAKSPIAQPRKQSTGCSCRRDGVQSPNLACVCARSLHPVVEIHCSDEKSNPNSAGDVDVEDVGSQDFVPGSPVSVAGIPAFAGRTTVERTVGTAPCTRRCNSLSLRERLSITDGVYAVRRCSSLTSTPKREQCSTPLRMYNSPTHRKPFTAPASSSTPVRVDGRLHLKGMRKGTSPFLTASRELEVLSPVHECSDDFPETTNSCQMASCGDGPNPHVTGGKRQRNRMNGTVEHGKGELETATKEITAATKERISSFTSEQVSGVAISSNTEERFTETTSHSDKSATANDRVLSLQISQSSQRSSQKTSGKSVKKRGTPKNLASCFAEVGGDKSTTVDETLADFFSSPDTAAKQRRHAPSKQKRRQSTDSASASTHLLDTKEENGVQFASYNTVSMRDATEENSLGSSACLLSNSKGTVQGNGAEAGSCKSKLCVEDKGTAQPVRTEEVTSSVSKLRAGIDALETGPGFNRKGISPVQYAGKDTANLTTPVTEKSDARVEQYPSSLASLPSSIGKLTLSSSHLSPPVIAGILNSSSSLSPATSTPPSILRSADKPRERTPVSVKRVRFALEGVELSRTGTRRSKRRASTGEMSDSKTRSRKRLPVASCGKQDECVGNRSFTTDNTECESETGTSRSFSHGACTTPSDKQKRTSSLSGASSASETFAGTEKDSCSRPDGQICHLGNSSTNDAHQFDQHVPVTAETGVAAFSNLKDVPAESAQDFGKTVESRVQQSSLEKEGAQTGAVVTGDAQENLTVAKCSYEDSSNPQKKVKDVEPEKSGQLLPSGHKDVTVNQGKSNLSNRGGSGQSRVRLGLKKPRTFLYPSSSQILETCPEKVYAFPSVSVNAGLIGLPSPKPEGTSLNFPEKIPSPMTESTSCQQVTATGLLTPKGRHFLHSSPSQADQVSTGDPQTERSELEANSLTAANNHTTLHQDQVEAVADLPKQTPAGDLVTAKGAQIVDEVEDGEDPNWSEFEDCMMDIADDGMNIVESAKGPVSREENASAAAVPSARVLKPVLEASGTQILRNTTGDNAEKCQGPTQNVPSPSSTISIMETNLASVQTASAVTVQEKVSLTRPANICCLPGKPEAKSSGHLSVSEKRTLTGTSIVLATSSEPASVPPQALEVSSVCSVSQHHQSDVDLTADGMNDLLCDVDFAQEQSFETKAYADVNGEEASTSSNQTRANIGGVGDATTACTSAEKSLTFSARGERRTGEMLESVELSSKAATCSDKSNKFCSRPKLSVSIAEADVGNTGFTTAAGKSVSLSTKAQQKAAEMWQAVQEDFPKDSLLSEDALWTATNSGETSADTASAMAGFTTAGGRAMTLSSKAKQKAAEMWKAVENDLEGPSVSELSSRKEPVASSSNARPNQEQTVSSVGFSTARGKSVPLSAKARQKATEIWKAIERELQAGSNLSERDGATSFLSSDVGSLDQESQAAINDFPKLSLMKPKAWAPVHPSNERKSAAVTDTNHNVPKGFRPFKPPKLIRNSTGTHQSGNSSALASASGDCFYKKDRKQSDTAPQMKKCLNEEAGFVTKENRSSSKDSTVLGKFQQDTPLSSCVTLHHKNLMDQKEMKAAVMSQKEMKAGTKRKRSDDFSDEDEDTWGLQAMDLASTLDIKTGATAGDGTRQAVNGVTSMKRLGSNDTDFSGCVNPSDARTSDQEMSDAVLCDLSHDMYELTQKGSTSMPQLYRAAADENKTRPGEADVNNFPATSSKMIPGNISFDSMRREEAGSDEERDDCVNLSAEGVVCHKSKQTQSPELKNPNLNSSVVEQIASSMFGEKETNDFSICASWEDTEHDMDSSEVEKDMTDLSCLERGLDVSHMEVGGGVIWREDAEKSVGATDVDSKDSALSLPWDVRNGPHGRDVSSLSVSNTSDETETENCENSFARADKDDCGLSELSTTSSERNAVCVAKPDLAALAGSSRNLTNTVENAKCREEVNDVATVGDNHADDNLGDDANDGSPTDSLANMSWTDITSSLNPSQWGDQSALLEASHSAEAQPAVRTLPEAKESPEDVSKNETSNLKPGGANVKHLSRKSHASENAILAQNTSASESLVKEEHGLTHLPLQFGFQTASGKAVTVSENALHRVKQMFDADLAAVEAETSCTDVSSNSLNSKTEIQIGKDAWGDMDENEDADVFEEDNISDFGLVAEKTPQFCGFQTASGTKVSISKKSLIQARKVLDSAAGSADSFETEFREGNRPARNANFRGGAPVKEKSVRVSTENDENSTSQSMRSHTVQIERGEHTTVSEKAILPASNVSTSADQPCSSDTVIVEQRASEISSRFCGFQTAAGKQVRVTDNALKHARTWFDTSSGPDCIENCGVAVNTNTPESASFGFQTAGGGKVSVSRNALEHAKRLFHDDTESPFRQECSVGQNGDLGNASAPKPSSFGFRTAGGGDVGVSNKALEHAKQLFQSGTESFTRQECSTERSGEVGNVPAPKSADFGFQTARGGTVSVLKKALEHAKHLFHDNAESSSGQEGSTENSGEVVNALQMTPKPDNSGFQAAGGGKVSVSKKAVIHAEHVFDEDTESTSILESSAEKNGINATTPKLTNLGFQTAGGAKVNVSKKALQHAKQLFHDNTESPFRQECSTDKNKEMENAPACKPANLGFQTAGGGRVNVSSKALEHAKLLFHDDGIDKESSFGQESSVLQNRGTGIRQTPKPTNFGFQTAGGEKVSVSKKALEHAQQLFHSDTDCSGQDFVAHTGVETEQKLALPNCGFQAAGGGKVSVSEKALERANHVLHDNTESSSVQACFEKGAEAAQNLGPANNCGFQTARGEKVSVSIKALVHAQQLMNTETESKTKSFELSPTETFTHEPKMVDLFSGEMSEPDRQSFPVAGHTPGTSVVRKGTGTAAGEEQENGEQNGGKNQVRGHHLPDLCFRDNQRTGGGRLGRSKEQLQAVISEGRRPIVNGDTMHSIQGPAHTMLKGPQQRLVLKRTAMYSSPEATFLDRSGKRIKLYPATADPSENAPAKAISTPSDTSSTSTPTTHRSTPSFQPPYKKPKFNPPQKTKTDTPGSATTPNSKHPQAIFLPPPAAQTTTATSASTGASVSDISSGCEADSFSGSNHCGERAGVKTSVVSTLTTADAAKPKTASLVSHQSKAATEKPLSVNNQSSAHTQNCLEGGLSGSCVQKELAEDNQSEHGRWSTVKQVLGADSDFALEEARMRQDKIIRQKKHQKVRPVKGRWLTQKSSQEQRKWEALELTTEWRSRQELLSAGVSPAVVAISSRTAEDFRFFLPSFYPGAPSGVLVGDGALMVPDDHGYAGKEELHRAFLTVNGVDPALISPAWLHNHYRWIVWKLAAYEVALPHLFASRALTPDVVMFQLKYRYDREVDSCNRSALKRIVERDDTPCKRLVLCICDMQNGDSGQKMLEVTDGWYSVPCQPDSALQDLIDRKKLTVGQKIVTTGAELAGSQDSCSPLEMPAGLHLKIWANSTRPVPALAKLGYQRCPTPLCVPVSSLLPQGGLVGCVDVVVVRKYPLMFMEKQAEGKCIFRTAEMEEKARRQYEEQKQAIVEKLCSQLQRELEQEESSKIKRNRRSLSEREVGALSTGAEISEAMGSTPYAEELQGMLSGSQMERLLEYHQRQQESRQQQLNQRLQQALHEKTPQGERSVVPMQKMRVAGCCRRDIDSKKSVMLTIWRPAGDWEAIQEGRRYRMFTLTASASRGQLGGQDVQLTAGRQTRLQAVSIDENLLDLVYEPREVWSVVDLKRRTVPYNEFDFVGLVITVRTAVRGSDAVYVADPRGDLLMIWFWGGLQAFSLHDMLKEGVVFAASNLRLKSAAKEPVEASACLEMSCFTTSGKSPDQRRLLNQLRQQNMKGLMLEQGKDRLSRINSASKSPAFPAGQETLENLPPSFLDKLLAPLSQVNQDDSLNTSVTQQQSPSAEEVKKKRAIQKQKLARLQSYGQAPVLSPLPCAMSPAAVKAFKPLTPKLSKTGIKDMGQGNQ